MNTPKQIFFNDVLPGLLQTGTTVTRQTLKSACLQAGISAPSIALRNKIGRGLIDLTPLLNMTTISPAHVGHAAPPIVDERTDDEIEASIQSRFDALDRMAFGVASGKFRSMICSGNPGIGKTYSLEYILEGQAHEGNIQYTGVRGYVKPTGIYKLLWENRHKNCVIMFDDADSVFNDEIGLNLLKGALDSTKRRTISWRSEKVFEAEDGESIPNSFDFEGAVVFVTNLNFDREVQRASKLTPHLEALISRSFYLDLNLDFPRELMVRIKQVVRESSMLNHLKATERTMIVEYMEKNMRNLRELSLRMAIKLGQILGASKNQKDFESMAKTTCLRRGKGGE